MPPLELLAIGRKAHRIYARCALPICRAHGLNQTEFDLLMFLANNPEENTARDACRLRGIKKGLVSITVDSLLKQGLIHRENDPDDHRIQRLAPTEAAAELVREGQAAQKRFCQSVFACLSKQEQETYIILTEKLMQQINLLDAGGMKLD